MTIWGQLPAELTEAESVTPGSWLDVQNIGPHAGTCISTAPSGEVYAH